MKARQRLGDIHFHCAAIHEAAHAVSAFHWGVPIGKRGVSLTLGVRPVTGFANMRWNAMPQTKRMTHAYRISTIIAPFAEFNHLVTAHKLSRGQKAPAAVRQLALDLVSQSRCDFGHILGLKTRALQNDTRATKTAMFYGNVCFAVWGKREPENWTRSRDNAAMTRDLVRDTDAMLRAYWGQIAAFANMLLTTDGLRLTAADVEKWRDGHFQRCGVVLSARAPQTKACAE
jgi:hypothetical protein